MTNILTRQDIMVKNDDMVRIACNAHKILFLSRKLGLFALSNMLRVLLTSF